MTVHPEHSGCSRVPLAQRCQPSRPEEASATRRDFQRRRTACGSPAVRTPQDKAAPWHRYTAETGGSKRLLRKQLRRTSEKTISSLLSTAANQEARDKRKLHLLCCHGCCQLASAQQQLPLPLLLTCCDDGGLFWRRHVGLFSLSSGCALRFRKERRAASCARRHQE